MPHFKFPFPSLFSGLIMGLILRYATAPSDFENGTVYDCERLKAGPTTLLVNITNQVYEYQYKREISQHNVNAHQGNMMLQKVKRSSVQQNELSV